MKRVIVSSGNAHKIREIRAILGAEGLDVVSVASCKPNYTSPEETGDTLAENALLKARDVARFFPEDIVVADDSGLFVDALGGEPGVHSARYAGEPCDDAANNKKLMEALSDVEDPHRTAAFRSVIALVSPAGTYAFEGEIRGCILRAPRGANGFGYDPYFVPETESGEGRTFAEMDDGEKNAISHRARALEKLRQAVERGEIQLS